MKTVSDLSQRFPQSGSFAARTESEDPPGSFHWQLKPTRSPLPGGAAPFQSPCAPHTDAPPRPDSRGTFGSHPPRQPKFSLTTIQRRDPSWNATVTQCAPGTLQLGHNFNFATPVATLRRHSLTRIQVRRRREFTQADLGVRRRDPTIGHLRAQHGAIP